MGEEGDTVEQQGEIHHIPPYRVSRFRTVPIATNLVISESLDRLSKADRADVQEIAASQIELLSAYYNLVLEQARRSFKWALVAAGVGLGFFLGSVVFLLLRQFHNVAVVSLISGSLVEAIAGINFYLYGRTSDQLADFHARLDATQRFLLANSICESLEGEFKERARSDLVRTIAGGD